MGLSRRSCSKTLEFVIVQKGEARSFAEFTLSAQGEILRAVYPERQSEILRFAQNDSEGLSMTAKGSG
jgi:hypothetical protein